MSRDLTRQRPLHQEDVGKESWRASLGLRPEGIGKSWYDFGGG